MAGVVPGVDFKEGGYSMALSIKKIAKATKRGRYADGHNLYLQVNRRGTKSWLLRYVRNGRERWMGLGPLHTLTLEEARARATAARQRLLDGNDPLADRQAQRAARALEAAKTKTFAECATAYFEAHERKWKNVKHRQQFLSTLKHYAFPILGELPVSEIDTGLVLNVIKPIWESKTVTADRVRHRIEKVLNWATFHGLRKGDNPARWKGNLSEVLPSRQRIAKTKHFPALPFADLPAFMVMLRDRGNISARALEFTILTAARTGEVIGARWAEIDLAAKIWTVPAGRIKGGREHRLPLSDRAVAILEAMPREGEWVFLGGRKGKPLSDMAMDKVLRLMGFKGGRATVHGFRSTFRDWAAECTTHPNHVVEMALAHAIGSKVEAAYRRGDLFDKRRLLMADWAAYCASTPVDAALSNINPMSNARAA